MIDNTRICPMSSSINKRVNGIPQQGNDTVSERG